MMRCRALYMSMCVRARVLLYEIYINIFTCLWLVLRWSDARGFVVICIYELRYNKLIIIHHTHTHLSAHNKICVYIIVCSLRASPLSLKYILTIDLLCQPLRLITKRRVARSSKSTRRYVASKCGSVFFVNNFNSLNAFA